jgi:hypothetical protein
LQNAGSAMTREIDVQELQKAINLILDHIRLDMGVLKISLEDDYYWAILHQ